MTREGKTVLMASLTVLMYGIFCYFQNGQLIFPFPLNEVIFLIVASYFATIHFRSAPFTCLLYVLLALVNTLSYPFLWSFFLDNDQMASLWSGATTDLLKMTGHALMIGIMLHIAQQNASKNQRWWIAIPILLLLIGNYYPMPILAYLSNVLVFIFSLFHLKRRPMLYLWVLFVVLESTKVWSLGTLV